MEIIRTDSLCKFFGSTAATNDISLNIREGEIYGFLGLNGAGKTTLIRILLGMIQPDKGATYIFGKELTPDFPLWNNIGYLVETPYAYPELTVAENLKVYYKYRQLKERSLVDDIIHKLKLEPYKNKKAKVLSLGNQQRLGLAKALLHSPKLLILDEPINGLDPEGIVEVRTLLQELSDSGTTIFLSSHILGEIAKIADRMGIIHNGRMIQELTTTELNSRVIKKLIVSTTDNQKAVALLSEHYPTIINKEGEIELDAPEVIAHPEKISSLLAANGLAPKKIVEYTEDLEAFFLRAIRN